MGTNYYRIPLEEEMVTRKLKLIERICELDISPYSAERGFATIPSGEWDTISPWDEFRKDTSIHLGKRSSGWKFCWNFNKNKYYSTRAELFEFIRSGRIIDEYGVDQEVEEFINMALSWGEPNGWTSQTYYAQNPQSLPTYIKDYHDLEIDGLRVSSSDSFC